MTTQLSLYNGALRLCKQRRLATVSEAREPRYLLDDAWGDGGTSSGSVKRCLEAGQWTFATRTALIDYSPSITPTFGLRYAFDKPTDLMKVVALCSDPYFNQPLLDYSDEGDYWYSDLQTIYVKWVSNGATWGLDMSRWPETFVKFVEADLASEIVGNLTQGDGLEADILKKRDMAEREAKAFDAMNKPTRFTPPGSWSQARHGGNQRSSNWNGSFSG
jgi:hypothetical protein